MIVMSSGEVEALLDLDELIDALADAHRDLSAGAVSMPTRIAADVRHRDAILAAMPAYLPSAGALTTKLVTLFPGNAGTGIPTHQAVILAFDPETGVPTAVLDGTAITAVRTGPASALSVRLLAREDASTLAVLGSGVRRAATRARSHGYARSARSGSHRATAAMRWRSRPSWSVTWTSRCAYATPISRLRAAPTWSPPPRILRSRWCAGNGFRPAPT